MIITLGSLVLSGGDEGFVSCVEGGVVPWREMPDSLNARLCEATLAVGWLLMFLA